MISKVAEKNLLIKQLLPKENKLNMERINLTLQEFIIQAGQMKLKKDCPIELLIGILRLCKLNMK